MSPKDLALCKYSRRQKHCRVDQSRYISRMQRAHTLDQGENINILQSHESHFHGVTQLCKEKLCTCIFPHWFTAATAQTTLFYELLGKAKFFASFTARLSRSSPCALHLWSHGGGRWSISTRVSTHAFRSLKPVKEHQEVKLSIVPSVITVLVSQNGDSLWLEGRSCRLMPLLDMDWPCLVNLETTSGMKIPRLEISVENKLFIFFNFAFTFISRTETPASKQCFISLSSFWWSSSIPIYEMG